MPCTFVAFFRNKSEINFPLLLLINSIVSFLFLWFPTPRDIIIVNPDFCIAISSSKTILDAKPKGITKEFSPRFLRRYLNLYTEMKNAVSHYIKDVKAVDFPNDKEQY